jgi:hypothetical protein
MRTTMTLKKWQKVKNEKKCGSEVIDMFNEQYNNF